MTLTLPRPFARQREFLTASERFVAYGGSRGGGKSFAVRLKATLASLYYPDIRILILRRSYPELYANHIKEMRRLLQGVAVYVDTAKELRFPNGATVKFGYCDADADADRYQGQEYDMIFMDEATHFTEYQFKCLSACLRGTNDLPKRFYLTCNPGGVGHAWVKRLFIDRDFREGERPEDYRFIRSSVYDNAPLLSADPSYLARLEALSPELRRAWLEGDWDAQAGQFFPEFRRDVHVVPPAPLPDGVRIYRALDYGLDMLACLWFALDRFGNVTVFRELYEPDLIASAAAARIKALSPEPVAATFAPPDLFNRQKDTGRSMWEVFEAGGVSLSRADTNRRQGWMQVKEYLAPQRRENGEWGPPRLRIYSTCENLIRTLPALAHDKTDPTDVASEPHEYTHLPDALRYFLRSRASPERERQERVDSHRARMLASVNQTARKGRFN